MLRQMKLHVVFLLFLLPLSCREDEAIVMDEVAFKNPSHKMDGKYDVVEFSSEKPVDLNMDDQYSNDLLTESGEWKNADRYFLHFITEPVTFNEPNPTLFIQKLFLWAPYSGVISETESGKYLYTAYSFTNLLCRCRYYERENRIDVSDGNIGQGEILSVNVSNETIRVNFIQSYYTSNGWERLRINASYKKRQ
jgi:hypothetical protein